MIRSSPSQRHRNSCPAKPKSSARQSNRAGAGRSLGRTSRCAQEGRPHRLLATVPPGGQEVGARSPPAWGGCLRSSTHRVCSQRSGAGMGSGGEHGWVRMTPSQQGSLTHSTSRVVPKCPGTLPVSTALDSGEGGLGQGGRSPSVGLRAAVLSLQGRCGSGKVIATHPR